MSASGVSDRLTDYRHRPDDDGGLGEDLACLHDLAQREVVSHDNRAAGLQVLRAELQALRRRIQETTTPLSPERDALLPEYESLRETCWPWRMSSAMSETTRAGDLQVAGDWSWASSLWLPQ